MSDPRTSNGNNVVSPASRLGCVFSESSLETPTQNLCRRAHSSAAIRVSYSLDEDRTSDACPGKQPWSRIIVEDAGTPAQGFSDASRARCNQCNRSIIWHAFLNSSLSSLRSDATTTISFGLTRQDMCPRLSSFTGFLWELIAASVVMESKGHRLLLLGDDG